jgi:hypothetical protein
MLAALQQHTVVGLDELQTVMSLPLDDPDPHQSIKWQPALCCRARGSNHPSSQLRLLSLIQRLPKHFISSATVLHSSIHFLCLLQDSAVLRVPSKHQVHLVGCLQLHPFQLVLGVLVLSNPLRLAELKPSPLPPPHHSGLGLLAVDLSVLRNKPPL